MMAGFRDTEPPTQRADTMLGRRWNTIMPQGQGWGKERDTGHAGRDVAAMGRSW